MEKMDYGQLSTQEIEAHEKRKKEKHNLFVFSDKFSYQAWKKIRSEIDRLKKYPKSEDKKAEKFADIFEEAYTSPEGKNPDKLPAFALLDLFERSFDYFKKDVSADKKAKIAQLQIAMLSDKGIPEALQNAIKGVWGYFADAEKREAGTESDEDEIREEFYETIKAARSSYDSNPDLLKNLSKEQKQLLYLPDRENWETFQRTEAGDIILYARLYGEEKKAENSFVGPLKEETENILDHDLGTQGKGKSYEKGEIEMPPHVRLYTIERSNILPKEETIAGDRVNFYITDDELALEERNRKRNIVCDELPVAVFEFLKNRYVEFRYSPEYRSMSRSVKLLERRGFVENFIKDLMNADSDLRENLRKTALSPEEDRHLTEVLGRYRDKKPKNVYLTYSIQIN